jgi:putative ABC transport system permease protein
VLAEAAALGAAGALLGLVLGYAVADFAMRYAGADLGAGVFRGLQPRLELRLAPAFFYFAAGVAIAVLGALLPALDAARTPPARALKAGDEQELYRRASQIWPGVALLAAGTILSFLPPVRGLPIFGYAAVGCLLLGAIALMPRVADGAFRLVPSFSRPWLELALAQLRGAPGQAAVSLAAIVASFSLMAAMAIMVASFRQSVDGWLDRVLPADLYFRTTHLGDASYLEPGMETWVRSLPQVSRAAFLRSGRILLDPGRPPVVLVARDDAEKAYPMVGKRHAPRPDDPLSIWVSEAVVDVYGIRTGQVIDLPLAGRNHRVIVAGVFRDYARQHGAVLIDRGDYISLTGDRRVNDGALWLAPGAEPAAAVAALRALPGGADLDIADPGEVRRATLSFFDRTFAVTYAMEAVAVLVGLFGLSSSLGAVVLARRREFGMLRHLGVTRRQVAAMLAAEGGLLAALGALAGLVTGAAISLVLVFVINRQSFNWGMEMHFPVLLLFSLAIVLILLSVLTAILSGREAMSIGPVRAVREDW